MISNEKFKDEEMIVKWQSLLVRRIVTIIKLHSIFVEWENQIISSLQPIFCVLILIVVEIDFASIEKKVQENRK